MKENKTEAYINMLEEDVNDLQNDIEQILHEMAQNIITLKDTTERADTNDVKLAGLIAETHILEYIRANLESDLGKYLLKKQKKPFILIYTNGNNSDNMLQAAFETEDELINTKQEIEAAGNKIILSFKINHSWKIKHKQKNYTPNTRLNGFNFEKYKKHQSKTDVPYSETHHRLTGWMSLSFCYAKSKTNKILAKSV